MNIDEDGIVIKKTPAGEWDVTINWACPSRDLGDDVITESEWSLAGPDSDLVLSDDDISSDEKQTTIWLSEGTLNAFYTVTNTITTANGRILTGTFQVQIVQYIYLTPPRCI